MNSLLTSCVLLGLASAAAVPAVVPRTGHGQKKLNIQVGVRPYYLIDDMDDSPLKEKLQNCSEQEFKSTEFVFAHRGAPLQFPEHTLQSYTAAHRQGAGVIECDVTFTKDLQLVCRHAQCDLHTTTNILTTPLAAKCTQPFTPASNSTPASAKCCTSDLTLSEFLSLCGKMDTFNPTATTPQAYQSGTPYFRTDLYAQHCPTLMTLSHYIALVDSWRVKFTPELKTPEVQMPFNNYTQDKYAQDLVDAFTSRGISADRVYLQSMLPDDIFYWVERAPAFAKQALYLDMRIGTPADIANTTAHMPELYKRGVRIMAPPIPILTKLEADGSIGASEYAVAARRAGMQLVTWSFERSGWLEKGGGGFYDNVQSVLRHDGDMYVVLDALVHKVGIKALFADWPATVVYYANCFGL